MPHGGGYHQLSGAGGAACLGRGEADNFVAVVVSEGPYTRLSRPAHDHMSAGRAAPPLSAVITEPATEAIAQTLLSRFLSQTCFFRPGISRALVCCAAVAL